MNEEKSLPALSGVLRAKRDRLLELLGSYGSCAIGFSGGLDSSVLAKAALLALGEKAVAVTAVGASMATGELENTRRLAEQIGIRHEVVNTRELDDPDYRRNAADRCYFCKTIYAQAIRAVANRLGLAVILDGRNLDDLADHRPGIRAAIEQNMLGPLAECELTKGDLRLLARHWNLPTWNKPATPCLSSRIAYGEEITADRLRMVDIAEQFLSDAGFVQLRVRYHHDDMARIEAPVADLPRLLDEAFRLRLVARFKQAGFRYISVDLEGFRSGSMNVVLPADDLELAGGMARREDRTESSQD